MLAAAILIVGPASASSAVVARPAETEEELGKISVLQAAFSHHIELDDALNISESYPGDVVGVRFENDQVVGEYFLGGDKSPAEFLAQFADMYGTQPEASSLLVAVDYRDPELAGSARGSSPTYEPLAEIDVPGTPFVAPRMTSEDAAELRENNRGGPETVSAGSQKVSASSATAAAAATTVRWQPQVVYAGTIRSGKSQYFYNSLDWYAPYGPKTLTGPIGIEFEINIQNGASGTRGSVVPGQICGPNFRDQFIAKNYNLNSWSISSYYGGVSKAYPYADLNDLFDPCGLNSMAVGLASPYDLPNFPAGPNASLETFIDAKVGTKTSSLVSGNLQLVDSSLCTFNGTFAFTDCMGLQGVDPAWKYATSRSTLNETRAWKASPEKCWVSADYGRIAPVSQPC